MMKECGEAHTHQPECTQMSDPVSFLLLFAAFSSLHALWSWVLRDGTVLPLGCFLPGSYLIQPMTPIVLTQLVILPLANLLLFIRTCNSLLIERFRNLSYFNAWYDIHSRYLSIDCRTMVFFIHVSFGGWILSRCELSGQGLLNWMNFLLPSSRMTSCPTDSCDFNDPRLLKNIEDQHVSVPLTSRTKSH